MDTFLLVCGLLHFTQAPAMVLAPNLLDWRGDFARLQPMNRALVRVVLTAIVIVVLGLGVVVAVGAAEIARGGAFSRAFTTFLSCFWSYRAYAQVVVYRHLWPAGRLGRASHLALSALFLFLAAAYGAVAIIVFDN